MSDTLTVDVVDFEGNKTGSTDLPADTVTAIDPGEGQSASPGSLVTLTITSTAPTEQSKATSTAGRPSPVGTSSSTSPPSDEQAGETSAAEAGRSVAAPKASKARGTGKADKADKADKAKSRPLKSQSHPSNRN